MRFRQISFYKQVNQQLERWTGMFPHRSASDISRDVPVICIRHRWRNLHLAALALWCGLGKVLADYLGKVSC